MSRTSKVLPLFVAGKETSIIAAVAPGGVLHDLDGIAYGFAKDTNRCCYITLDHEIQWMIGANKPLVQKVNSLPTEGDPEVLYIMNGTVYSWDAENSMWVPTYQDITEQLSAVTELVNSLSEVVTDLTTQVSELPTVDMVNGVVASGVQSAKEYADDAVDVAVRNIEVEIQNVTTSVDGVSQRVNAVSDSLDGVRSNVEALDADLLAAKADIDELKQQGTHTDDKIDEVEQQTKEYTDQKIDDVLSYVNETFELREV